MDFEAFGRYTHAVETAQKLQTSLNTKLIHLTNDLKRLQREPQAATLPLLSAQALEGQLSEILRLHRDLAQQFQEANLYAERCGKPPLYIESP